MNDPRAISYSKDDDGVGWIVFDDPDSAANVLSPRMQEALASAFTAADRDSALKALVLTSAKQAIFIAGADLNVVAALPDAAAAEEFSRRGQRLFQRIADSRVPVVCAIHGACAGGGLELALACDWRMASDADVTRIGLPETSLGTIPGWGGCVRLPRLIGTRHALDHILKAELISAAEAGAAGMVHEVVRADQLSVCAKARALELAARSRSGATPPDPAPADFNAMRATVRRRTHGHYPALLAAIDAIEQCAILPVAEALEAEARIFGEVTVGPVCKNLVRVFFLREAARKRTLDAWFEEYASSERKADADPSPPRSRSQLRGGACSAAEKDIRRVGVVGAGVMGSGIAQWLAARGFEVVLRDVQPEFVERGMMAVRSVFDEAVARGKLSAADASAGLRRIATTTSWDRFEACDLVIEAILEDAAAKQALFSELASVVRPAAILASNTSALPIEEIAAHVPNPERALGIHFFNPVSRMSLVELIIGRNTSAESANRALAFVKAVGKSPIICRSSPGFLVTRVLFFYLNEAVRRWEQGTPAAVMDGALRDFGWPMGPLRLIDEVGVDVTDFIFGEMEHYFPRRFTRSTACARMLAAGMRGRKNGTSRGFYRYENHTESSNEGELLALFPDRAASQESSTQRVTTPEAIVSDLMNVMSDEVERCLAEGIVKSPDDVDFAFLSGAGFPPFRGGLLHWSRAERRTKESAPKL